MSKSTLRISEVPVSTLGAFLEACSAHPTGDVEDLAGFAGFSPTTARRALPTLESLALIGRDASGGYVVTTDGVRRGMGSAALEQVIRRGLLGYRPFEVLVEGLALGESVDEAVRKALRLLGLPESESPKLRVLLRWGEDLGIIEHSNGRLTLTAELGSAATEEMGPLTAEDVESEARARLFNSRRLGRSATNYLDETDRALLAGALLTYETDPRKSVDASGQALEDFLREVADDRGMGAQARKVNGAIQVASVLVGNNVVTSHHEKLVEAPATIRNATAHRKDKRTMRPWEVTPTGAFAALMMTLTAIRSIHHYIANGRQVI